MEVTALVIAGWVGCIYWHQLDVMTSQLGEMQGGSTQTDRLICLYRQQLEQLTRQAGDTHDLAVQTKSLADRMKDQAAQTKIIAEQARVQANAAMSAAVTASRQLELTERPWLFVKDARVATPLKFDANGAQVEFEIVLRNSGHSPAVEIFLYPQLYLLHGEEGAVPPVEQLCVNKVPRGESRPGLTVFPETDSPPQRITVELSRKEMADASKHPPGVPTIAGITPIICVWYRPTFNPDARYYSGVQYLLWPAIWPDKMLPGSSIPANSLSLTRNEFFGEVAH
jgi:hypothetical protein